MSFPWIAGDNAPVRYILQTFAKISQMRTLKRENLVHAAKIPQQAHHFLGRRRQIMLRIAQQPGHSLGNGLRCRWCGFAAPRKLSD